jgi:hypothetical protein
VAHGGKRFDGGVAAIGDGDDLTARQPAREQQEEQARPVGQRPVPLSLGLGVALGGRQRG